MSAEENGKAAAAEVTGGDPGDARPFILFVSTVTPAEITYGPLLGEIGDRVRPVLKELEVLAEDTPPPGYDFGAEVEGIRRAVDEAGQEGVHLVGFSAGASAALAFAARYPERARSLALVEPPFIGGGDETPEEDAFWAEADAAMALPPPKRMVAFLRLQLRPGVEPPPPPPGPPPPWMAKWPAALQALHFAFKDYDLDPRELSGFRRPVYFACGSLSNPAYTRMAQRLDSALPNVEVEIYEGRHHLDAPHKTEPERFARALRVLWRPATSRA